MALEPVGTQGFRDTAGNGSFQCSPNTSSVTFLTNDATNLRSPGVFKPPNFNQYLVDFIHLAGSMCSVVLEIRKENRSTEELKVELK